MAILSSYPRAVDPFRIISYDDLNINIGEGIFRNGINVFAIPAQTITLVDNQLNYIGVDEVNEVYINSSYTGGIPLYRITTNTGLITSIIDDRALLSIGGQSADPEQLLINNLLDDINGEEISNSEGLESYLDDINGEVI